MIGSKQQTLQAQVVFNGFGIHSGKFCEITLSPLKADSGIVFRSESQAVVLSPSCVRGDARGTQIVVAEGVSIATVEHLLAAIIGCGIDNVLIDVDGPEIPIKDGSAKFFAEKIQAAGIKELSESRNFKRVSKKIVIQEKDKAIVAIPAETLRVHFCVDYDDSVIKTDMVTFDAAVDDFAAMIAPARTYGFDYEIEYLWEHGKALGVTTDNAIAVSAAGYSLPLRFPDEIARHKILDFIGDLATLGRAPLGEFFVFKSGHQFNAALVRQLAG